MSGHEGGCLCGALRYRAQGDPLHVVYCHCTMCRRAAGAPVVAWATFASDAFAWLQGEPVRYASSAGAVRTFCGHCGSPLTFQFNERPEQLDVTLGTLDAVERLAPTDHIFTASQVPWLRLDDTLPRHAGFKGSRT